jgi:hypothetical protein
MHIVFRNGDVGKENGRDGGTMAASFLVLEERVEQVSGYLDGVL